MKKANIFDTIYCATRSVCEGCKFLRYDSLGRRCFLDTKEHIIGNYCSRDTLNLNNCLLCINIGIEI